MRWLVTVAAVLSAILPLAGTAIDAPHDSSFSDGACNRCHSLYLTTSSAGVNNYTAGCLACHDAAHNITFAFPWVSTDQARPGVEGNQHAWDAAAQNAGFDVKSPSNTAFSKTLVDGKIQCTSCHVPHDAGAALAPGSKHASMKVGVAKLPTGGTGSATMTLVSEGTAPNAWRIKIQADRASFVISHDFGLGTARTWLNWVGGVWVTGTETGAGKPFVVNTPVALDDAAVTVRWSAAPNAGDYWDFYVSYPFLRASIAQAAICNTCHKDREMGYVKAQGNDPAYAPNGVRRFSHPVGEGLNANLLNRDRGSVLDVNGQAQGASVDTNATNDLVLDVGIVRCTTCHAVHNADSNSLTTDAR